MESQSENPVTLMRLRIARTYGEIDINKYSLLSATTTGVAPRRRGDDTHIRSTRQTIDQHPEVSDIKALHNSSNIPRNAFRNCWVACSKAVANICPGCYDGRQDLYMIARSGVSVMNT